MGETGAAHGDGSRRPSTRKVGVRGGLIWVGAVLIVSALVSFGVAWSAAPRTPKSQRIAVLTRALGLMARDYGRLQRTPGPEDVFAYRVGELWKQGIDGTGTTIAVIEGWNSPPLKGFVASHDRMLGLPDPQIKTIFPTGEHRLPASCPSGMVKLAGYGSCRAWEGEAALDVLSAHVIAPYAKILVVVAPPDSEITDDAASNVAPPEFMQAVEYVSARHLANVISISDGTGESTYSRGFEEIRAQDPGELTAAAHGIPVLVATGDCGAAMPLAVAGGGGCAPGHITTTRATGVWADSPWVTAVGGSIPNLSATGRRLGPDPVWNFTRTGNGEAEGAGFSAVYATPSYQDRVAAISGSPWRSVPDITMNASSGTSESAPLLAGVLALATQLNHAQNVGPINNALYRLLGPAGLKDGVADVVSGNNTLYVDGKVFVPGFTAAKGFDVASGWGTVRADTFARALARATSAAHQDAPAHAQAAAALASLKHREQLSSSRVAREGTTFLTAQGFLPGHPVELEIDGRGIVTLHADKQGSVSYQVKPLALGLQSGRHIVDLHSMLITTTSAFHYQ